MPKLAFTRSIVVQRPAGDVFARIAHLGQWPAWSPWVILDPKVENTASPDGKHFSWKGPRTGSGEMHITGEVENESVDIDLVFLTPFKSKARIRFDLSSEGDGTKVAWSMDGGLPFFLFFMTKVMTTMLGMDFERGLRMLKDLVERGSVPSVITYPGETTFGPIEYVGITTTCPMDQLGESMMPALDRLRAFQEETGLALTGAPLAIYREWDIGKLRTTFTVAFPVAAAPKSLPSGIEAGHVPELSTYVLEHRGAYHHLGNAWTTGMTMSRAKEFKQGKAPPFEVYVDSPASTPEAERRVAIHFPLAR